MYNKVIINYFVHGYMTRKKLENDDASRRMRNKNS